MFDTNIFDRLLDDASTLSILHNAVSRKKIELVSISIQRRELEAVPDLCRGRQLLSIFDSLSIKVVLAEGGFWSTMKWNQTKWGSDGVNADLRAFVGSSSRHRPDAMIAVTASRVADWLVTENHKDFQRVAKMKSSIDLLSFEVFKQRLSVMG